MITTALRARQRATSLTDDVEVIVARPDVGADAVCASAKLLSNEERERAARFAFEPDRRRYIVTRALLRQLLAARLGIPPEAVELAAGARGKPALAGQLAASALRFNVSHCQDVAVYAFASGREVGIDVEAVRELPDADDVAARWFSPRGYAAYRALAPGEPARILRVEDVPGDRCRWRLEGFSPVPGFVAAVVAERPIEGDR